MAANDANSVAAIIFARSRHIVAVDAVFTTLPGPLFTNAFEISAPASALACVWRAGIAD
jgi:hypothetical protein